MATSPPPTLFYIKRTVLDFSGPVPGPLRATTILGTYTSINGAKRRAATALPAQGYEQDLFAVYKARSGKEEKWEYGEEVWVHAVGHSGMVFEIAIEAEPNEGGFAGDERRGGIVVGELWHVLETIMFFDVAHKFAKRTTTIKGTFRDRPSAEKRAQKVLEEKKDFAECYEIAAGDAEIVHGIGHNDEEYLLEVVQPGK